MRILIKLLFLVIILLLFLFAGTYVFLALQGRAMITRGLAQLTSRKVSIGRFSITPPLNISLVNLEIEGLAKTQNVQLVPSLPYLLTGNIAFNLIDIAKPEIYYERLPQPPLPAPAAASAKPEIVSLNAGGIKVLPPSAGKAKEAEPLRLIVRRLIIRGGKVEFNDRTVGKDGIKLSVRNLELLVTNLCLAPCSAVTTFDIKANIPWRAGDEEGRFTLAGWVDFFKRDLQAQAEIKGIDGVYLYPYYSKWVDLEKARIEKASLNFIGDIRGIRNNITMQCHLELTDIVRMARSAEEPPEKAEKITDTVLDMFKAMDQGKIVLDFTIRTKMDRPEFGFGSVKMAFEDKVAQARAGAGLKPQDVLLFPGRFLEKMVKGTADLSRAVVDGTVAVSNEVSKVVVDTWKTEPSAKQAR
jgi:hypothetical protein